MPLLPLILELHVPSPAQLWGWYRIVADETFCYRKGFVSLLRICELTSRGETCPGAEAAMHTIGGLLPFSRLLLL